MNKSNTKPPKSTPFVLPQLQQDLQEEIELMKRQVGLLEEKMKSIVSNVTK